MKHVTFLAALAMTSVAVAQRTATVAGHPVPADLFNAERTPTDTIVPASLMDPGSSLVLYTSSASSYVAGTNNFGDKAKVQVFNSTGSVLVEQLLFLAGAKDEAGASSSLVHARVYALDGTGADAANATVNTAPGSVLGNVDVPISAWDTSGFFTVASFNPAVAVTGNFGGGFDVADLATGVGLGLLTTTNGDPGTAVDQNWEKFSDDSWVSLNNGTISWGLQLDIAILAVLGDGVAGIGDNGSVNNMRMSFIGSNPAQNSVVVAYEMLQDANARMVVLDSKGAQVVDQQLGRTAAGLHQSQLNVSEWSDGTYYVSVFANGNPITKKLVVKH
jgi:hypothetical protein